VTSFRSHRLVAKPGECRAVDCNRVAEAGRVGDLPPHAATTDSQVIRAHDWEELMKKQLIVLIGIALPTIFALAQGTVDFRNGGITFPTPADRKVYYCEQQPGQIGPGLVGTTWVAGLWYLPGADRGGQIGQATQVGGRTFNFRSVTTSLPGTWVTPAGVSPIFTFPDVAVGGSATLQVRVWNSASFNSWDAAIAGGREFLSSAPFNYTVPPAGSTPDKYYMDNLRAFAVLCPEPSSVALCLLCAACVFFLSRRN